ncbi:MAG: right-handed parallel beta-helix repeat-containing protein [Acidobacteriaceae bacterium]
MRYIAFILMTVAALCGDPGVAAQAIGSRLFVDCSAPVAGDGSFAHPWNSLDAVAAHLFQPGDVIALRRGTTCHGVLAPRGSGSVQAPIRLTAYGEGPRPKIVAPAAADEALRLYNQEYWDIDSLDVSGGTTRGIFISGDRGVLHHIHLENLAVHDVMGGDVKHKESGLVVISPGSANQRFDDVLVDGVTAWNTNQWVGILVGGGDLGYPPESDWSTNAVIRNSAIHDVQGDGIVLFRIRGGTIEDSVAWNTGMQNTETIGTPNAIWTWMCDGCTVENNEAYLTDSPGVDGGAYDIDYGNTGNSVIDNYAHDTQGYCVAVFGAGFVTRQSTVRGNLCIDNSRSPRMTKYQGAILLLTWNNGSLDGLTIEDNTVYWNPLEDAPALLNEATIAPGIAVFRNNSIESTSPWLTTSNTALAFGQNHYTYFGTGTPKWTWGAHQYSGLGDLQKDAHQGQGSSFTERPLQDAPQFQASRLGHWRLACYLPVSLDANGMIADKTLQQMVVLRSFSRQYHASGLQIALTLTAPDAAFLRSAALRQDLRDLDLGAISVSTQSNAQSSQHSSLTAPDGHIAARWNGFAGPVPLGLALRKALGQPAYAQMQTGPNE